MVGCSLFEWEDFLKHLDIFLFFLEDGFILLHNFQFLLLEFLKLHAWLLNLTLNVLSVNPM